jgi:hypothetical protein
MQGHLLFLLLRLHLHLHLLQMNDYQFQHLALGQLFLIPRLDRQFVTTYELLNKLLLLQTVFPILLKIHLLLHHYPTNVIV